MEVCITKFIFWNDIDSFLIICYGVLYLIDILKRKKIMSYGVLHTIGSKYFELNNKKIY